MAKHGKRELFDPKSGKPDSCHITFDDDNTLKVRGYIGFSLWKNPEMDPKKLEFN